MTGPCVAALLALAPFISGWNQTPLEKLNYALQHVGGSPGQLGYEAKQQGFDYRQHLRRAIDGKESGLAALFDFTLNSRLTGDAARQHGEILYDLLRSSGDDLYSRVLRTRRPAVRRRVFLSLDLEPEDVGQHKKYPETFGLRTAR